MKNSRVFKMGLAALMLPFLFGCPKARKAEAPEPDLEFQSAVDMTFAMQAITDIDMICAFQGVNEDPLFYSDAPLSVNSYSFNHNPATRHIFCSFYKTQCVDGVEREGTVVMNYSNSSPNANLYWKYEFTGRITLSEYKVNGWLIKTKDGIPCNVYCKVPSANFDPQKTNLSWLIEGTFEFTHPTDPARNMVWKGNLIKELLNASDNKVFSPGRFIAIDWTKAKVSYSGTFSGNTSGNIPFNARIDEANPLLRDFTCSPDMVGGVVQDPTFRTWKKEYHPFVDGIVHFSTGERYPRQIFYGNEDRRGGFSCDNSGIVRIKGISHRIDFIK